VFFCFVFCVLCFAFVFSWGIWKLLFCFTSVLISFLLLLFATHSTF
jgi:hypothetical protein